MKRTLLEIVQDISAAMDGDEVGSIDDTFEAEQIVNIVRSVHRDMVSNRNWPHLKKAFKLNAYSDPAKPTHMSVPDNIKEMCSLSYNTVKDGETRLRYKEMTWLENDAFLRRCNALDSTSSTVDTVIDDSGIQLLVRNDKAPQYFTSFDDKVLVFDSYDKAVDTTLQKSKTQGVAYLMPTFTASDSFEVELPEEAFSAFYNEIKSLAFLELRQTTHSKAEQESRRQQRWLSRKAWGVKGGVRVVDYGRRSKK
jgi:hypothetical protein